MKDRKNKKETPKLEDELEKLKAEREKLMEEAASHLKGRRPMTREELEEDAYINFKINDHTSEDGDENEND